MTDIATRVHDHNWRIDPIVRSLLDTVNGYSFTPMAAAEAARRMLLGDVRPGFQVPARHFGAGFAETIADTRITDVQHEDPERGR